MRRRPGSVLGNLPQEDKPKKTKAQRRKEARAAMEELRKDVLQKLDRADSEIIEAGWLVEELQGEFIDVDNVSADFTRVALEKELSDLRDSLLEIEDRLRKSGVEVWYRCHQ